MDLKISNLFHAVVLLRFDWVLGCNFEFQELFSNGAFSTVSDSTVPVLCYPVPVLCSARDPPHNGWGLLGGGGGIDPGSATVCVMRATACAGNMTTLQLVGGRRNQCRVFACPCRDFLRGTDSALPAGSLY